MAALIEFAAGFPVVSHVDCSREAPPTRMKRFLLDVFAPAAPRAMRSAPNGRCTGCSPPSIVLPLAVFATGAAISYRQHLAEAHDRLQRNLGTVYEHALKVFETFEITSRYLDELLEDVTDEQIRANEADYNARLRALHRHAAAIRRHLGRSTPTAIRSCPGTVFPMPRQLDLSDRDYFRAHKNNEVGRRLCRRRGARRAPPMQRGQPALLRAQPQAHRRRTASSPA